MRDNGAGISEELLPRIFDLFSQGDRSPDRAHDGLGVGGAGGPPRGGKHPVAQANPACCLGLNEIYGRVTGNGTDLAALARDETDYKGLIAKAKDTTAKLALAQKLATRRLASGVVPELDACFAALELEPALA